MRRDFDLRVTELWIVSGKFSKIRRSGWSWYAGDAQSPDPLARMHTMTKRQGKSGTIDRRHPGPARLQGHSPPPLSKRPNATNPTSAANFGPLPAKSRAARTRVAG